MERKEPWNTLSAMVIGPDKHYPRETPLDIVECWTCGLVYGRRNETDVCPKCVQAELALDRIPPLPPPRPNLFAGKKGKVALTGIGAAILGVAASAIPGVSVPALLASLATIWKVALGYIAVEGAADVASVWRKK